jgi:hypothetical protein
MEVFGLVVRVPIYVGLMMLIGATLPASDMKLASLTIGDLVHLIGGVAVGGVLVWYLFHPSTNVDIRRAWGGLGTLALTGVAIFVAAQLPYLDLSSTWSARKWWSGDPVVQPPPRFLLDNPAAPHGPWEKYKQADAPVPQPSPAAADPSALNGHIEVSVGGSSVSFPNGTDGAVIQDVMMKHFGPGAPPLMIGKYQWTPNGGFKIAP